MYLHTSCTSGGKARPDENPTPNPAIPETLRRADDLFRQREDMARLREAIDLVSQLRQPGNRDFDVEWKFAMYNCFLGRESSDDEERGKAFELGKAAGQIASRIRPDRPEGYFWYGANLGELSRRSPVTVGIASVDDIREAMNKVIELDPDYQGASAYDALAQIELSTAITGGSAAKAVEYLEQGIAIEKDNTNLYLDLARAYLAVHRDADARRQLEHVLTMQPHPDYIPEHKIAVAAAKKMLETRF